MRVNGVNNELALFFFNKKNVIKIFSVAQIRQADSYTIANEPVKSVDLMERAATACADFIKNNYQKHHKFHVFCGTGNNGGDGLAISRLLLEAKYNVITYIVNFSNSFSVDFAINKARLVKLKYHKLYEISDSKDIPEISGQDIVVDAIFGSGLNKPVTGFVAEVIEKINNSKAKVIAIDIPSGLFADDNTGNNGVVLCADETLSFQFPKLSFLFAPNNKYVGRWHILPIGLHNDFINNEPAKHIYITQDDAANLLKLRNKFAHKGNFGHALLIAGSLGKIGAAVLASKAALHAGCGLLTAHIPQCGYNILQTALPEAMVSLSNDVNIIDNLPELSAYNAIAIGPGLDQHVDTAKQLKLLIQNTTVPLIIDADALNILAENKTWLSFLPQGSVLTPHPKEFERIVGKTSTDIERLELQREYSIKYRIYIIYKGAHSATSTPDGHIYFNSSGNPGMATAGSGDVLTGILLGLRAQNYAMLETCILGTYLHGLAGDIAAKQKSQEAMLAGDVILAMGKAFKMLHNRKRKLI